MIVTSTMIVSLCAKLAALSSNQAGLATSDFLNFANITLMTLASEILNAREEYLVYQDSLPVAIAQTSYRIPYRSINTTLRHLWFEDGTGARYLLYKKEIDDIEQYNALTTGTPSAFYLLGNQIIMLPSPVIAGNLLVAYPFRPNLLVDATTTQTISTFNGSNQITIANTPSNFTSGALYDIIDSASGNGIIYYDQAATVSGTTMTFTNNLPNIPVGAYIAQAGQSPVPMIPEEGHPLLLEQVVMRIEMVRGNAARIKNSAQLIVDARKAWDALLTNRVVSKPYPAGAGGAQWPSRPW